MATFELNNNILGASGRNHSHGERFENRTTAPISTTPEAVAEELACHCGNSVCACAGIPRPLPPVKQESIFTPKIYDSCRKQDCLTEEELGFARYASDQTIGEEQHRESDLIFAPRGAASVLIEDLCIRRIIISNKRANVFKRGYWDVDVEYVFEYTTIFHDAHGRHVGEAEAISNFRRRVTLFGSMGSGISIETDLIPYPDSPTHNHDPFVLVEAKAMALAAHLVPHHGEHGHGRHRNVISVTVGLFSIIKLFRLVTLLVESRGFSIPRECDDFTPVNPCDFFDHLPFPMDTFAPPQKREFEAGICGDIAD
ncbi:MAG: hypothetical protein FWC95_02260 [Defluviitaleaceae bacterium]|nr:hypothetical protein [Defluviitaleaceae bacterium]